MRQAVRQQAPRGESRCGAGSAAFMISVSLRIPNVAVRKNVLPLPTSLVQPMLSTHQVRQALADGQSETRSAVLACGGRVGLSETVEDHFRFVRGNPDPGVDDVESQLARRFSPIVNPGSSSTRSVTEPRSVNFSAFPTRLMRICRRRFGSPTSPRGTPGRISRVSCKPRSCAVEVMHLDYFFEKRAQIEPDRFQFDVS